MSWKKIKNALLFIGTIIVMFVMIFLGAGKFTPKIGKNSRLARRKNEIDDLRNAESKIREKVSKAKIDTVVADTKLENIARRKETLKEELKVDRKEAEEMDDEELLNSVNSMLSRL